VARVADAGRAALAVTVLVVFAGCGSSSRPSKPHVAPEQHISGPTHPGGNTTKGE